MSQPSSSSRDIAEVANAGVSPSPRSKPRRLKRVLFWVLGLALGLLLLVLAIVVFRNPLLKIVTEFSLSDEIGMPVQVDGLNLGFTDASLQITGLKIVNRPEFGGSPFVDIPEIYFRVSGDSSNRQFSFSEIRFHLAQINVVRNEAGEVNIDTLKKTRRGKKKHRKKAPEFELGRIEKLVVTVGSINFIDLGHPERNQQIKVNIDHEVIKGIRSETDLQARIVALAGRVALEQYFKQPKGSGLSRKSLTDFLREVTGQELEGRSP